MAIKPTQFSTSFFENNPSFTATNHVVELTQPLRSLRLNYFTFDRHYIDGSRIVLTNHAQWIKHYWQSGIFKDAIFEKNPLYFTNGHIFWDWLNREPIYAEAALHGIDHGVTLTEHHEKCCDFFHFGAVNDNKLTNNLIINNIGYLHKFISIFKHKMKSTIEKAEKDRIFTHVCNDIQTAADISDLNRHTFDEDICSLLGKRDTSRIYLGDEFNYCHLTRSEALLLKELVAGSQYCAISDKLNITDDAVGKHIKSIKAKLGCKTLCQVGFIAGQLKEKNIYPTPQ